ncbi:MAG: hypothetical protein K940chlam6_01089 [Chlamydiae bacterium]|nr:hypothetical protein [Chlamydiota bacterium]
MSMIKQTSDVHQGAINAHFDHAQDVVKKAYDPATDSVLNVIEKGTSLISKEDAFTQKFSSYQSVKNAKGLKGKVKAIANDYDVFFKKLDGVSIIAGEKTYEGTKHFLNVITGSRISRSRVGRIIQEGVATLVGGAIRIAIKVVEYFMRLLPYLTIAAALAFGAYKGVLAMIALYVASKAVFGVVASATAIIAALLIDRGIVQYQINKLSKKISGFQKDFRNSKVVQSVGKSFAQKVKEFTGFFGKHKGKAFTTIVLSGALLLGYAYSDHPIVTETAKNMGSYFADFFKPAAIEPTITASYIVGNFQKATGKVVTEEGKNQLNNLLVNGTDKIASIEAARILTKGSFYPTSPAGPFFPMITAS